MYRIHTQQNNGRIHTTDTMGTKEAKKRLAELAANYAHYTRVEGYDNKEGFTVYTFEGNINVWLS